MSDTGLLNDFVDLNVFANEVRRDTRTVRRSDERTRWPALHRDRQSPPNSRTYSARLAFS